MSILSKILGVDKAAQKAAKEIIGGILGSAQKDTSAAARANSYAAPSPRPAQSAAPSGVPAEENQYNYNGTYEQYFEHIFREDFPAYRFEKSYLDDYGKHRVVYTFFRGAGKALAVELMPESSEAAKFRNECRKANLPYLRFYYDHEGWWNLRSYVVGRIRGVLN